MSNSSWETKSINVRRDNGKPLFRANKGDEGLEPDRRCCSSRFFFIAHNAHAWCSEWDMKSLIPFPTWSVLDCLMCNVKYSCPSEDLCKVASLMAKWTFGSKRALCFTVNSPARSMRKWAVVTADQQTQSSSEFVFKNLDRPYTGCQMLLVVSFGLP